MIKLKWYVANRLFPEHYNSNGKWTPTSRWEFKWRIFDNNRVLLKSWVKIKDNHFDVLLNVFTFNKQCPLMLVISVFIFKAVPVSKSNFYFLWLVILNTLFFFFNFNILFGTLEIIILLHLSIILIYWNSIKIIILLTYSIILILFLS